MNPLVIVCVFLNAIRLTCAQWSGWGGWGDSTPSPDCGDTISVSTKLTADLVCDCSAGPALVIEGIGNVLDLNGHFVSCGGGSVPNIAFGVRVEGKSNSIIGPGNVTQSYNGIYVDGEGGHAVSRVSLYDNQGDGIRVRSDSNTIDKCNIELSGDDGIEINSDKNTVSNCVISNVDDNGVVLEGSFNVFENNHLDNMGRIGIISSKGIANRILSNVVSNAGQHGISLSGGGSLEVRGNEIFQAAAGFPSLKVSGFYDVDGAHIVDNHIHDNSDDGIDIDASSTNIVIEQNVVSGNNRGIYVNGCSKCHFIKNTIHGNAQHGIYVDGFSDTNLLSDNVVTNNGNDGVFISNGAHDTVLVRNTIWGNTPEDLDNREGSTIFAGDNIIEIFLP